MSTRERLLTVAIKRFAESGFERTSVRDICDRARANPGAISYHFGGKAQLRRAVIRHAVEALSSALDDELPSGQPLSTTAVTTTIARHPMEVRLLLRELADGGQLLAEAAPPQLREHLSPGRDTVDPDASDGLHTRRILALQTLASGLLAAVWPFLERHFQVGDEERATACDAIRSSSVR